MIQIDYCSYGYDYDMEVVVVAIGIDTDYPSTGGVTILAAL